MAVRILAMAGVLLAVALPLRAAEISKDSLPTVLENVSEDKAVLVDVREQREWDKGHIENAILLPLSALDKGIDADKLAKRLPKDKIVYTHCVVGKRAVAAGELLEQLGYEVRPLKPGYKELLKAGFKQASD